MRFLLAFSLLAVQRAACAPPAPRGEGALLANTELSDLLLPLLEQFNDNGNMHKKKRILEIMPIPQKGNNRKTPLLILASEIPNTKHKDNKYKKTKAKVTSNELSFRSGEHLEHSLSDNNHKSNKAHNKILSEEYSDSNESVDVQHQTSKELQKIINEVLNHISHDENHDQLDSSAEQETVTKHSEGLKSRHSQDAPDETDDVKDKHHSHHAHNNEIHKQHQQNKISLEKEDHDDSKSDDIAETIQGPPDISKDLSTQKISLERVGSSSSSSSSSSEDVERISVDHHSNEDHVLKHDVSKENVKEANKEVVKHETKEHSRDAKESLSKETPELLNVVHNNLDSDNHTDILSPENINVAHESDGVVISVHPDHHDHIERTLESGSQSDSSTISSSENSYDELSDEFGHDSLNEELIDAHDLSIPREELKVDKTSSRASSGDSKDDSMEGILEVVDDEGHHHEGIIPRYGHVFRNANKGNVKEIHKTYKLTFRFNK